MDQAEREEVQKALDDIKGMYEAELQRLRTELNREARYFGFATGVALVTSLTVIWFFVFKVFM